MDYNVVIIESMIVISIGLFTYFLFELRKKQSLNSILPNLAATLGVLGTFIGISFGLYNFDSTKLEVSVVELLGGMKTSFITSIIGMTASILMKIIQDIYRKRVNVNSEDVETGEVIISELKGINSALYDIFSKFSDNSNQKQDTLITELRAINTVVERKHNELVIEFRAFAKTMAEQNSKSLIEALNDVIKDFNNKLNEQFGENFKQLNIAVGKLVEWQENYKEMVVSNTEELNSAIKVMRQMNLSIDNFSEKANIFIKAVEELDPVLSTINESQNEIKDCTENLIKFSKELKITVPEINKYISETTERFNKSLDQFSSNIENMIKLSIEGMDSHMNNINETAKRVGVSLDNTTNDLSSNLEKIITQTSSQIREMVEQMEIVFTEKVKQLDSTLEQELTKSLNTLGTHLVQISNKFAEDYTPLANKLRDIVNIAKGA